MEDDKGWDVGGRGRGGGLEPFLSNDCAGGILSYCRSIRQTLVAVFLPAAICANGWRMCGLSRN